MTFSAPKGRLILLEEWFSRDDLVFKGKHLAASDEYYEWYATHEMGESLYHLCVGGCRSCRWRAPRGNADTVIHVDRWRPAPFSQVIAEGYGSSAVLPLLKGALEADMDARTRVGGPASAGGLPAPPPRAEAAGSVGLDKALASLDGEPFSDELDALMAGEARRLRDETSGRPATGPKPSVLPPAQQKASVNVFLAQKAAERANAADVHKKKKKRKNRDRGRSSSDSEVRPRDKRLRDDSDSSDSEQLFRKASSRGVDLGKLSRQKPGCLLKSALREMRKYLSARGEASGSDPAEGKVLSYLNQVVLNHTPAQKMGLRSHRELTTLATGLDLLLEGSLGRLGDLLVQRFKAVEASFSVEGGWAVARHQEIIPNRASLSTLEEQTEAAKAELRAQKLQAALARSGGVSK